MCSKEGQYNTLYIVVKSAAQKNRGAIAQKNRGAMFGFIKIY